MAEKSVARSGSDVRMQSMTSEVSGGTMVVNVGDYGRSQVTFGGCLYDNRATAITVRLTRSSLKVILTRYPFVHRRERARNNQVSRLADESKNQVMACNCSVAMGHWKHGPRRWRK